jgi:hypothetical protein
MKKSVKDNLIAVFTKEEAEELAKLHELGKTNDAEYNMATNKYMHLREILNRRAYEIWKQALEKRGLDLEANYSRMSFEGMQVIVPGAPDEYDS